MNTQSNSGFPIFYSYIDCPYCQRARAAIAASGQKVELREVTLPDKPEALLKVSPNATVPVLVLADGTAIDQSMEIVHWALAQDDPLGWRQYEVPQVEIKALMEENDSRFAKALVRVIHPERFTEETDGTDWDEVAAHFLGKLEQRLENSRYLAGNNVTLADVCIAPFVLLYAEAKPDSTARYAKTTAWIEGFRYSDLYRRVMQEYDTWHEGSEPRLFP